MPPEPPSSTVNITGFPQCLQGTENVVDIYYLVPFPIIAAPIGIAKKKLIPRISNPVPKFDSSLAQHITKPLYKP